MKQEWEWHGDTHPHTLAHTQSQKEIRAVKWMLNKLLCTFFTNILFPICMFPFWFSFNWLLLLVLLLFINRCLFNVLQMATKWVHHKSLNSSIGRFLGTQITQKDVFLCSFWLLSISQNNIQTKIFNVWL